MTEPVSNAISKRGASDEANPTRKTQRQAQPVAPARRPQQTMLTANSKEYPWHIVPHSQQSGETENCREILKLLQATNATSVTAQRKNTTTPQKEKPRPRGIPAGAGLPEVSAVTSCWGHQPTNLKLQFDRCRPKDGGASVPVFHRDKLGR